MFPLFTKKDLLERPEDLQPLGSFKGYNNQPNPNSFTKVDIYNIFYSKGNRMLLINNLFNIHQQNGGKSTLEKFQILTPKLMNEFCKNNNLYLYEPVETESTEQFDWSSALKSINYDFIKFCYKYFKWNNFNPFREYALVGESGKRKYKKFSDLMPDDYGTIDVWREQYIQISNKNFRDNNQIPIYRTAIHSRNFDRGNEGLREGDPDRASLENYQRPMDMTTIIQAIDNYRDYDWFGM